MPYFGAWPEAVARLMKKRGVRSRRELARRAGLPASTVSDYLNRKQEPGVVNLEKLLRGLGADFSDLHSTLLDIGDGLPPDADAGAPVNRGAGLTLDPAAAADLAAALRKASDLLTPATGRNADD